MASAARPACASPGSLVPPPTRRWFLKTEDRTPSYWRTPVSRAASSVRVALDPGFRRGDADSPLTRPCHRAAGFAKQKIKLRHTGERRYPGPHPQCVLPWTPVFAGVTRSWLLIPEPTNSVIPANAGIQEPHPQCVLPWTPACAGVTRVCAAGFPKQKTELRHTGESRLSRAACSVACCPGPRLAPG
jgi:hypothetical protein